MAACLTIMAVSGLLGCADTPVQVAAPEVSAAVAGTDSVALTYICGNMFRIRNSSFEPRRVRWEIYNASPADTGSLWARGRDVGRTSVDFFVTARTKGTMRLFVGTTLVSTKANGNKVACAAPVDAAALPQTTIVPALGTVVQNTAPVVEAPDSMAYRRTLVNLQFRPSATNAQRRAFQVNFNAQLVGVFGTVYQFRLPDLGASYSSFRARIEQIGSDSTVLRARAVSVFDRAASFGSRYPDDAPQFRRSNYVNRDSSVWVATALRLPQAWSCETGQYGGILPRIAIFEQNFPLVPASDVSRSLLTPVIRDTSWRTAQLVTTVPADSARYTSHGHSVAALVSASGDDSTGLAGPLWRSDLRVITPGNVNEKKGAGAFFFYEVLSQEILRAAPRILSLSSDYVINPDTLQREADIVAITLRFRQLLDSLPMLLIVQAVGNDGYQGSYAARDTSLRNIFQEALVAIRSGSTTYRDRIVFVGETDRNGNRPTESNEFSGLIDLYAPGFGVPILLADGTVAIGRGTSFAAPIVAGIAGQLLAMDPTLSAKDLKDLLLRGAEDSVENANGDNIAPSRVGNTTDVVYEADAYGSLRLLSGRGNGRPLCGAAVDAVRARGVPPGDVHARFSVVAQLYGGTSEVLGSTDSAGDSLLYPGLPLGTQLSVAPGGRSFSVTSVTPLEESRANLFQLQNTAWSAVRRIDESFGVLFGERDTLFLTADGAVVATATSGRLPLAAFPFTYPTGFLPGGFSFAPDGSAYAVTTEASDGFSPADVRVVRRSGITSTFPGSSTLYATGRATWLPDSRSLVVSRVRQLDTSGTRYESTLTRLTVGSSSLAVQQQNVVATGANSGIASLGSTSEGGRIVFRLSGPFFKYAEADCSIQSATTGALNDVRIVRQLLPGTCGVTPPPGGGGGSGGGGQDLRIARSPDGLSLSVTGKPAPQRRAATLRERTRR